MPNAKSETLTADSGDDKAKKLEQAFDASAKKSMDGILKKRQKDRESWDAFWELTKIEARGNPIKMYRYYGWRVIDFLPKWTRENVIEPLHDKFRWPYYHRQFSRVREIDECEASDQACIFEANWQYRLDRMVDTEIMRILREQVDNCLAYYHQDYRRCTDAQDLYEENELNFFTKYGELALFTDVVDAYMKQKHRLIWERRHPKLMQLRAEAYEKHKEEMAKGIYNDWFYNRGTMLSFVKQGTGWYRNVNQRRPGFERDDISQDPQRLKEEQEMRARGETVHPNDPYKWYDVLP